MIGALWTGISGLAAQQTALDNESNNIANVNTIGYKASRISFADQMYQDKIGKGSTILDAEKIYTQGSLKLTGVSYDMALNGNGFFAVSNASAGGTAETFYTRAGNFRMGDIGTLQDSAGNDVQGWAMSDIDASKGGDVTTTNSNVTIFTSDYIKLAASQIIKKSTSVETITAKMTDYNTYAKADNPNVFTGAGYKSKSTKISNVETLITSYSSKLTSYSSNPDAVSTPSVAQNSYLDFDLDNATVDSGDQIYVYINGTKYAQSFDTNENTTLKKLVDQLSNVPGINAYIGASTAATYPSPSDGNGYVIIESIVPGDVITIGDVGIVHDGSTSVKTSGTNTAAISGTGFGAVKSAMQALRDAVAGNQRDVWAETDISDLDDDDSLTYTLTVGDKDYTVKIETGKDTITTDSSDTTTATLSANLADGNKIDMLVEAINSHSYMSANVVARNINGSLVIESKTSGEEFSSTLQFDDSNTGTFDATNNKNSDYSINSGAASEFMQIKTTIDQTSSKNSLQLRLDSLGISDSAFGDFEVDNTGLITMKQDGAIFAIGQVAIALFNDNRGLDPVGDNLLSSTERSGSPIYNLNNNKTADIKSKTLELSTADLSESLVNLMVFQRAFEANAKSITTADTILNTLINLKR